MLTYKKVNIAFLALLLATAVIDYYSNLNILIYLSIIFGWVLITSIGSFNIGMNYHLRAFNSNPECLEKKIALTFDDGPHQAFTSKILDILFKYDSKATFFCVGKNIERNPNLVRRIFDEGHHMGNHSYSHSRFFGFFGKAKITRELIATNAAVSSLVNKEMLFFRPPFGITNPSIRKALKQLPFYVVGWNIRSLDTIIKNKEKLFRRITRQVQPGDVILMHDTNEVTVEVLEQLLIFLKENSFELVTLEKLLKLKSYA